MQEESDRISTVNYDNMLVACHLCWSDRYGCLLYVKTPSVVCSKAYHHRAEHRKNTHDVSLYLLDEIINERNEKIKLQHIPNTIIEEDNDPVKFFKYD